MHLTRSKNPVDKQTVLHDVIRTILRVSRISFNPSFVIRTEAEGKRHPERLVVHRQHRFRQLRLRRGLAVRQHPLHRGQLSALHLGRLATCGWFIVSPACVTILKFSFATPWPKRTLVTPPPLVRNGMMIMKFVTSICGSDPPLSARHIFSSEKDEGDTKKRAVQEIPMDVHNMHQIALVLDCMQYYRLYDSLFFPTDKPALDAHNVRALITESDATSA